MSYTNNELYCISNELRKNAIKMVYNAKTGHAAPCFSMAEMITVLYFDIMNINPEAPHWKDRDRFVLSKGHASPIYYAVLAKRGFFPEEDLLEYRALNSKLQGHPDMRKCPGVDMTTGSLGNGLSAALGMAIIAKKEKSERSVYCIVGDGETQEGIIWEATMFAGNSDLDNLIVLVDYNGLQSGGPLSDIQDLGSLEDKFKSFKWNVHVIDGHDIEEIKESLNKAKINENGKPTIIIAKTIKGKGVSYMEGQYLWHMKAPNEEEYNIAVKEIGEEIVKYV